MKKIINGLRYNTEKADVVCKWKGGQSFSWFEAVLYCTPRAKRFFIAGKGGSLTVFYRGEEVAAGSSWSDLLPVDEPTALLYAKQYASPESLKKFFPEA